ncbi:hypothetical protein N7462_010799 [Penicillium macrosclerotiorum]|uniref:uncharacterized protein n=1 Tax=Penicillium macrosclerotiorum TaxID=303699 RepID=UPI002548FAE5|nr:uncharacterized protein N7462_010799 [Penicillium macrosclerotiorum]KAJ5669729.1 hypothetical protein N7462_010799 [Penicillium macrosclerotiorum]
MGCMGDREKGDVSMEEKWDYVNLDDFKSDSCWTGFSYFWLWVFLVVSIAVYGVDTFTAVNLLAFSRWSGRVEPAIPFKISRWIYAVCILVSFALLIYRWLLAIRSMRSGSITRSYLDPLAVRVQSVRVFTKKGRGWKRFLVFAELTKSKKGAEYVALYAYFSFQSWLNLVFADGPRQVINAITLWSVMKSDLLPGGRMRRRMTFFNNVKILAEENNLQAVVLIGMLFTLVIWVLSILKLASAIVLYLIFLFHHIPAEDGTLTAYCRRKISTRLTRIVRKKVNKALASGFKLQDRKPTEPMLAAQDTKPTLPSIDLDKTPVVSTLSRTTTQTTLPPYTRSNSVKTDHNPTLPNLEFDSKPPLSRTTTQASAMSESASLTGNAAGMGFSPLDYQSNALPPLPPLPATLPSTRPGTSQSRPTPGLPLANNSDRNSPAPATRNLTDPYARSGTPGVAVSDDYFGRSHAPAAHYDPYGSSGADYEDDYGHDYHHDRDHDDDFDYRARTETPFQDIRTQQHSGYLPQEGYPTRSYSPASTGAMPRAPPVDTLGRSVTPASYRSTPAPRPGQAIPPPPRSYTTPMSPPDSTESQGGGYTAFNPPTPSQTPQPYMHRSPGPAGYQPFNRANTVSPGAMNRNGPPAGYSFNRANTDQF